MDTTIIHVVTVPIVLGIGFVIGWTIRSAVARRLARSERAGRPGSKVGPV